MLFVLVFCCGVLPVVACGGVLMLRVGILLLCIYVVVCVVLWLLFVCLAR